MIVLWFDQVFEAVARRGSMVFAYAPDGVWAVLTQDFVYPDDLASESDQLLGHVGAGWAGIGHLLLTQGVALPAELEQWAARRDVPASQLGGWFPSLLSIDGVGQLSLSRDFGSLRAFASTRGGRYVFGIAPVTELIVKLVNKDVIASSAG